MVEKITITPQEVRGLGDIISPKTLSDFNKQYSTLTETTDTVHGVTTTIYDLENTTKFFDAGITGNKNTNWLIKTQDQTDLTATIGETGTTLTNTSTTTSRFYYVNTNNSTGNTTPTMSITGNFTVEADIISQSVTSPSQIALVIQGASSQLNLRGYTTPYTAKIVKNGTTITQYINGEVVGTTTITNRSDYYFAFQLYRDGTITYKNYRITQD